MPENSGSVSSPEGDGQLPPGVIAQATAVAANTPSSPDAQVEEARPSDGSEPLHDLSSTQEKYAPGFMAEAPVEDAPPPAYSETYGLVDLSQLGCNTRANVASDGRLDITINQKSRRLSNLLVPALHSQLHLQQGSELQALPPGYIPHALEGLPGQEPPPRLNVVIHVVGSRGDVQPFISLGQVLKLTYGHRVRLATHPVFRDLIEDNGLEFFNIGGDPAELMAFMVKNPGLMPGKDALRSGDIGKRRKGMYEIIRGCWRSCFEAGDGTGVEVSDSQMDYQAGRDGEPPREGDLSDRPFVADAIIANPPSFAHVHCAEKLGVPLHLMFTMPWSPTQAFPHPLANIQSSNADVSMTNFITYALVEMMTWQGLGDVINRFREKSLGLEPVSLMWAPGMASRLRIPFTYCWSPALIPKPKDWGPHISVSGFFFLPLAQHYNPAADLASFLGTGPPPIYIGFGSIVVDDPDAMTKLIFEAIKRTGQRALVSKGWGGLGADTLGIPEDVFMLGNVPHDWLFKHVSCVVHHGGAGTTAAGIALGKPTVVVPFFGDQPFWGAMIAKAGAGPLPIPYKHLTADKLAAAIMEALKPTALQRAQELGRLVSLENGSDVGAQSFHTSLLVDKLRCSLAPSRVAVWRVKRTAIRLSAFAAAVLGNEGLLDFNELKLYRPREYDSEDGPWEPISGAASALLGTIGSLMMGVADFPVEIFKAFASKSSEELKDNIDTRNRPSGSTSSLSPGMETSDSTSATTATSDFHSSNASTATLLSLSQENSRNALAESWKEGSASMESGLDASPQEPGKRLGEDESKAGSTTPKTSRQPARPGTESPCRQISFDTAIGAGKGVGRIVGAGLKSPMDFTLSLARGFHNAPKLYGDESVRQSERITGFQSGMRAAGKEFGFGFYDGISGLVTQPLEGAKKEGVAGLLKGFGKGIGGLMLKPAAAIWGLPGYTFKGIYKELQKHLGSSVQNYIIAARTAQGYEDWRKSSQQERLDIVSRWHATQVELGKQKKQWRNHRPKSFQGLSQKRHSSLNKKKEIADGLGMSQTDSRTTYGVTGLRRDSVAVTPRNTDYEEAIRESVAATSTGNVEEDAMIEKAIRASVAELQRASQEGEDRDATQRAIQASIAEASRARPPQPSGEGIDGPSTSSGHDRELEAALSMSLRGHDGADETERSYLEHDWDDSDVGTDNDENIMLAMELSKRPTQPPPSNDDDDLQRALKQSQEDYQRNEDAEFATKTEEEIVLEYVKKQSLAEAEHKGLMHGKQNGSDVGQ